MMEIIKEVVVKLNVQDCLVLAKLLGEMSKNDYTERHLSDDEIDRLNVIYKGLREIYGC